MKQSVLTLLVFYLCQMVMAQVEPKTIQPVFKDSVLYVLDGKQIFNIASIDKNTIKSIHVWKGDSAINKFGIKGKNGVVEIISKPEAEIKANAKEDIEIKETLHQAEEKIFVQVEKRPEYKSGLQTFVNANKKPIVDKEGYLIEGKIIIKFKVDLKGNLSDFVLESDKGESSQLMFAEAVRILKLTKPADWLPAMQNGKQVIAWQLETISF